MYSAVRENLVALQCAADAVGRVLPRYFALGFKRYLDCGQLACGFACVRCDTCRDRAVGGVQL